MEISNDSDEEEIAEVENDPSYEEQHVDGDDDHTGEEEETMILGMIICSREQQSSIKI